MLSHAVTGVASVPLKADDNGDKIRVQMQMQDAGVDARRVDCLDNNRGFLGESAETTEVNGLRDLSPGYYDIDNTNSNTKHVAR